ncbi:MAG TPA: carboxyltransferase domain-containing protein [Thermoanaerobaculia bacterium]|nr:carboxyltransferase domain-containing protein [Thermoanaerobaculia bacterium]
MNEQLSIRRAGHRAVLAVFRTVSLAELQRAAAEARSLANVEAVVIGHSSLLVLFDSRETDAVEISSALQRNFRDARVAGSWVVGPRPTAAAIHEIGVSFSSEDAPDLPDFLGHTGMTGDEFLSRIRSVPLRARYLGFRPGFAYLEGLPPEWWVPRRQSSRTRVPAGSFAVGGEMAGFYPTDSPGGWNLLGRTSVRLWDPAREQPNLIGAGDEIRIRPVHSAEIDVEVEKEVIVESGLSLSASEDKAILATVRKSGQLSLIVLPRNERRYDSGLPPGGRFDETAAAAVNRAVGNPPDAAVLECAMVGPTVVMHRETILSWWGAEVSIRVNGKVVVQSRLFEDGPGMSSRLAY